MVDVKAGENARTVAIPMPEAAFLKLQAEIQAVPEEELSSINLDVQAAVTTVLGSFPQLNLIREDLERHLGPGNSLERLAELVQALSHAHSLYRVASTPARPITQMAGRALELRELLFSDATALAKRGLLDGSRLKELKGTAGYRNVAFDIMGLSPLLRLNWKSIENKTAMTFAELEEAERIGTELAARVGERERNPAIAAAQGQVRAQAFTLFMRAYDSTRRAVIYLRWMEGDADQFAPSLYAGRRSAQSEQLAGASESADEGAAGADSDAEESTAPPVDDAVPALPTAVRRPAPGLPGGTPFVG